MPIFATCLNCIDGRVQLPVINWIINNYNVDYVDMITEPGMDGLLADPEFDLSPIQWKINLTIKNHDSAHLFIVGHYDCAGNPVSDYEHKKLVRKAVERFKGIYDLKVVGLWLDLNFNVEKICE